MGIFDDYGIDTNAIKESSFEIEDGTYLFEIGEAETQNGTTNNPENDVHYIEYNLFDEEGNPVGNKRAYYTLSEDGDSDTKRVQQSLSFFKADLKRLGVTDLSEYDGSQVVGLKGVLQLKSSQGKGANRNNTYQNIRNVRLDEAAPEAPVVKKPVAKPAAKPAAKKADTSADDAEAKKRIAANKAAREAAEAESTSSEDEEEGNPFGA